MSVRNRRNSMAKAQNLIPESRVSAYAIGRSGSNPVVVGLAIVGTFVALGVAIALASGAFVLPGVLVFLVLQHLISPPRGIAVCEHGIAVTNRSLWTGKPTQVLDRVGVEALRPIGSSGGRVQVAVGHERVWLTVKEEAILRQAVAPTFQGPVAYAG